MARNGFSLQKISNSYSIRRGAYWVAELHRTEKMLLEINPAYIILKPSLIGGLKKADDWIKLASSLNIQWWSTSALESNIGLNAISQWAFNKEPLLPQGLGTGMLYSNNIDSPYFIDNGFLKYNSDIAWNSSLFKDFIS